MMKAKLSDANLLQMTGDDIIDVSDDELPFASIQKSPSNLTSIPKLDVRWLIFLIGYELFAIWNMLGLQHFKNRRLIFVLLWELTTIFCYVLPYMGPHKSRSLEAAKKALYEPKNNTLIFRLSQSLSRVLFWIFFVWSMVYWVGSWITARKYYHEYLENMGDKPIKLHQYWALDEIDVRRSRHFNDLEVARSKRIKDQLSVRDDFKIEKSKCHMYEFMQKNNINHPRISQVMETEEAFWKFIEAFDTKNYPLIVKFCHLTQGSQGAKVEDNPLIAGNTYFLKSKETTELKHFKLWVKYGFNLIPADPDRPWTDNMAGALATLEPGIFVQSAWPLFPELGLVEVRVFVLWGKAYYVRFDVPEISRYYYWNFEGGRIWTDMFPWPFNYDGVPNPLPDDIDEHMKGAIAVAERDARILRIDMLRVDLFLNPNDPSDPGINEHSIFEMSNMLWFHDKFITDLWKRPYLEKQLNIVRTSIRSYNMTAANS